MINAIIPECYVDTCLVNILLNLNPRKGANHAKGNSSVAKKMQTDFKDRFAVGIIDRDKREIKYIQEFELRNDRFPDKLRLFKHPDKHHYFIQLCPESESWICTVARELDIDMGSFNLSSVPRELARESKNVAVSDDDRFVRLFNEIRRRALEVRYEPVTKLMYWLEQFRDHTYNVNIGNLTN